MAATSSILVLQEISKIRQLEVGILIFDKVEVLDFCGPFETLSVCRLDPTADDNVTESPFRVSLIAESKNAITTIGGMQVLPHGTIDEFTTKSLDILILPGGFGTRQARLNPKIMKFIRDQKVHILASVCTGAMLLAESGALKNGASITTHWQLIGLLKEWYPQYNFLKDRSVVKIDDVRKDDGGDKKKRPLIYNSAGISAGIHMCFWMIKDLFGEEVSRATAKQMEYSYPEDFTRRIEDF